MMINIEMLNLDDYWLGSRQQYRCVITVLRQSGENTLKSGSREVSHSKPPSHGEEPIKVQGSHHTVLDSQRPIPPVGEPGKPSAS